MRLIAWPLVSAVGATLAAIVRDWGAMAIWIAIGVTMIALQAKRKKKP